VADAGTALKQLTAEGVKRGARRDRFHTWHRRLHAVADDKATRQLDEARSDSMPIHPLRLCTEVREFMDRDAILVVDGAEILNYARQSIPTFVPCHRLNSGPFGTMGVGLPFGLGAKAAKPAQQVIVLHGDGSFGLNGMELDTAIRHNLPVLVVISLNGGWSADPTRTKPGRDLGYTRFDQMAQALGCHGEHVERPEQIRPALERAMAQVREGRTAVVNVVTDWAARSSTANFTTYVT
jgi:acetolactate synthase-1/2/3 large subunit